MKNAEILEPKMSVSKRKKLEEKEDVSSKTIPLEISLKELDSITVRMRKIALIVFGLTLFNTFFPVFIFSGAIYRLISMTFSNEFLYRNSEIVANTSLVIWGFVVLTTLLIIYLYDSLRKKGDVLFEEISDELEWNIKSQRQEQVAGERPEISARVSLRSFAKTTDLPFVPGKFGPAFYLIFNVLIPLFIGSRFFRF